jgi:hypothetical protein
MNVGAALKQESRHVDTVIGRSRKQRSPTVSIRCMHVGPNVDEEPGNIDKVLVDSLVQ